MAFRFKHHDFVTWQFICTVVKIWYTGFHFVILKLCFWWFVHVKWFVTSALHYMSKCQLFLNSIIRNKYKAILNSTKIYCLCKEHWKRYNQNIGHFAQASIYLTATPSLPIPFMQTKSIPNACGPFYGTLECSVIADKWISLRAWPLAFWTNSPCSDIGFISGGLRMKCSLLPVV